MRSCQFIDGHVIEKTLGQLPTNGKHQLEPLNTISKELGIPYNVLEDHQFNEGLPEVHRHEDDLWVGIEGEIKFIVEGVLEEPWLKEGDDREVKGRSISGGREIILKAGDVLKIPAGVPHSHTAVHGRAFIIKIPERNLVPLDEVPGWKKTT